MSELKIHWFLPTGGDSRDVLPEESLSKRAPSADYLTQIATAAEGYGFDAVLTPCGTGCEDAWITTATLVPRTKRLRFLVAFRPGLLSPTLAAQMASTYQRMSGGRMLVNIVTGAEPRELHRFGDYADKPTRYARTGEFMGLLKRIWSGEPVDHDGEHYRVEGATTRAVPHPAPEIYFGGASDDAKNVAAQHADVYLCWGETPEASSAQARDVAERAEGLSRTLRYGIRFHVIARPSSEQAWAAADQLLAGISDEAIAKAREDFASTRSEGQRRMAELHGSERGDLLIHPNVWAGVGLVRGGVGTTLVGSYEEIADRIEEYADVGFSEFILSGYPHLEEAHWFGEGVFPLLRRRGRVAPLEHGEEDVFSFR